jgi:hypothetical protein
MIPDFNDFHIAIGFTVGYGTPVLVEELITYIIENFDIEYESEAIRTDQERTRVYECIIRHMLEIMAAIKEVEISPDGKYVTMNKKGAKNIENHDDEICKRLRIIFRKNAHKRPAEE